MKFLVFDTETTGLYPGNICQLSYIIRDEDRVSAKNFYFSVDYIEYGAQRVHGLTVELLRKYSEGRRFIDFHSDIKRDFEGTKLWVAHNVDFDLRFLKAEFTKCRCHTQCPGSYCTMKGLKDILNLPGRGSVAKYPRLEELTAFFNIREREVEKCVADLFGESARGYHDARFDAAATYCCFEEALKREYIKR